MVDAGPRTALFVLEHKHTSAVGAPAATWSARRMAAKSCGPADAWLLNHSSRCRIIAQSLT